MVGKQSVIFNQRNRHRQKYQFYVNVFDFLNESSIAGDYFEFGCHPVRTFRMALTEARRHHMTDMQFLALIALKVCLKPHQILRKSSAQSRALATASKHSQTS